jgi:Ca2+-binding RTX toxin-like protein
MGKTIVSGKTGLAAQSGAVDRILPLKGGTSGNDVFNGTSGNDTFDGGNGSDTIYGGGGNDVLRGGGATSSFTDLVFGGDGDDTLTGGGSVDSLFGGAGNDFIFNEEGPRDGEVFDGGAGADVLDLTLSNLAQPIVIRGGPDDVSDGNDYVQVKGRYELVDAELGHGNDKFIGGTNAEQAQDGLNSDRVGGGDGNDLISTWYGNDRLSGDAGSDVLWGGSGDDTLFGGNGTDYLYGGIESDTIYGGGQTDIYYWSREDGRDQIYDEYRTGERPTDANAMLVFGIFDSTNNGTLKPGTGVFETDTDIMNKDGMVQVTDVDDGGGDVDLWRLEILTGDGAGNYVEFDPRDVPVIALSNHEAPVGQGLQYYLWNEKLNVYEFTPTASIEEFDQGVRIF